MTAVPSTPWIAFRRPNPDARLRLFCFPYAGGGASLFVGWIERFAPAIDIWPVQLPGRETRLGEPAITRLTDVADRAFEALTPYFNTPFALFGYSLGAALAYEVAQRARERLGVSPQRLIVAAHRAPQLAFRGDITYALQDGDFRLRLRQLNGTRPEVLENEELMQLMMPLLRADFELHETYTHTWADQPLDCPITAFGAVQDDEVPPEDLDAWRRVTRSSFERRMFEGGHFFIHRKSAALAEAVNGALSGTPTRS